MQHIYQRPPCSSSSSACPRSKYCLDLPCCGLPYTGARPSELSITIQAGEQLPVSRHVAGGCHCLLRCPYFKPSPALVIKASVLPFHALISPPPPLNLWSCSSKSTGSALTFLAFPCGGGGELSEQAAPLSSPFSRPSTREQLHYLPKVPRQTTKLLKCGIQSPSHAQP